MAVNCPASPEENPLLGLSVPYPKWLHALVAPRHCARLCKATVLSTCLSHSHALISLLANVMGFYTFKSPADTVFPADEIPLSPFCTADTSSLPHFFPPSPPPQHCHAVPFTTSLYCHKYGVSSGAECDTEPRCCMFRLRWSLRTVHGTPEDGKWLRPMLRLWLLCSQPHHVR